MISRRTLISGFVLLGFIGVSPASAEDPLLSRVGRISAVDGAVAVRPAGGEWAASGVNHPVAAGMSVRTQAQGRAVLRVGAETIALGPSSELDLARLDADGTRPDSTRIVLRQGRIGVRLAQPEPAGSPAPSIEIAIARGGVWLLTPGEYDIIAGDERTPARIAVVDGRARLVDKAPGAASDIAIDTTIASGAALVLSGGDPVAASLGSAGSGDFVAWWRPPNTDSAGTDKANSPALRHLSTAVTGYEALDGNGSWETVKGYGAVWFPTTARDDWAPYRHGHWRSIAPWGWTWIDDMPWGFAPSHYGRWASISQANPLDPADPGIARWGWVPGTRAADPALAAVYAPALVAFLGTAGVGLSYPDAFGPAVAWFPLAPDDIYWPGYTKDLDAIRRINQGAVADLSTIGPGVNGGPPTEIVNDDYPNRRFASVVPRSVFVAGRPVAPALLWLPGQRLENAPLLAGSPHIAPAAPRPAAGVVSASAAIPRLAAVTSPRLARAVRTLAGILQPSARIPAAQMPTAQMPTARPAVLVRPAPARTRTLALSGRSPMSNAQPARPRVIGAATPRAARPRLHLATNHRTMVR